MHPIDCIKTLQQTDAGLDLGFWQASKALYAQSGNGWSGFYRGFLVYAIADGCGGALKFSVWETWKSQTTEWTKTQLLPNWIVLWMGAGLAFVASSVLTVPGELLKNQLQVGNFAGLNEAVTGIYQEAGVGGFFNGYVQNHLARSLLGNTKLSKTRD